MLKLKHVGLLTAATLALAMASSPASAGGNIFLTGHDTDYHSYWESSASGLAAMAADVTFVKNGSSLPLLVFDNNSLELSHVLDTLGIAHTTVDPSGTILDTMFDASIYSAFAVASNQSCGGCDLSDLDVANIAAHSSAINAFFNAGGGILGFAAASDAAGYAYVPEAAANAGGSPPPTGFVETPAGTLAGLLAENGDITHNYFPTPGTGGLSSAYQIAEVNGDNVESVFIKNGTISCTGDDCTITGGVPEPSTWAMMLLGFGAIGFGFRSDRKKKALPAQIA
jgi:PEP-CTERM motif-containing protein